MLIGLRHVPESLDPDADRGFDLLGSALGVIGLGGVTFALIEVSSSAALPFGVVGVAALVGFLVVEARSSHPLMPLHLFRSRVFSVANAMTLVVYGALGAMLFFLVIQLQVVVGYSPWQAGLSTAADDRGDGAALGPVGRARRPDRPAAADVGGTGAGRLRHASARRRR